MMEGNNNANTVVPVTASTRLISALIDYIPMMMFMMIGNTIGMASFFESFPMHDIINSQYMGEEESLNMMKNLFSSMTGMLVPLSICMALSYIYFLSKDLFGGRSPGKRLQKLQLVRLDGSPVSYPRMILRNLFIVIWPVEVIMYLANSGQRLGDIACKTTVVAAAEEKRQPLDKQKIIISMLIISVFCTLLGILYYWSMTYLLEWYVNIMETVLQQSSVYAY